MLVLDGGDVIPVGVGIDWEGVKVELIGGDIVLIVERVFSVSCAV